METAIPGRWLLVLPPEGAARQVGQHLWAAMEALLPAERRQCFDTAAHLRTLDQMLRLAGDELAVDFMGQSLAVQALDFGATHVVIMALAPVTYFTVNLLKRQGVKTVHWFIEDYRRARYWEKVLPAYTHWFAIQRGPMEAACASAGVRCAYLPTAAEVAAGPPLRPWAQRRYDLAFVGMPSPYRLQVLEALRAAGLSLALAGPGWDRAPAPLRAGVLHSEWVDTPVTLELLRDARLGLHAPYDDPGADRADAHVSPRLYEVLACGGALLCEDSPLCREAVASLTAGFFAGPDAAPAAALRLLARPLSTADQALQQTMVAERHNYRARFASLAAAAV